MSYDSEAFPNPDPDAFVIISPITFLSTYLAKRRAATSDGRIEGPMPPDLPDLTGSDAEKDAYLPLFVSAILEGEYRQSEGIDLEHPLNVGTIMLHDQAARDIISRSPALQEAEIIVTPAQVDYAGSLVRNLRDMQHAAQPLAMAAFTALQEAFQTQHGPA